MVCSVPNLREVALSARTALKNQDFFQPLYLTEMREVTRFLHSRNVKGRWEGKNKGKQRSKKHRNGNRKIVFLIIYGL